MMLGGRYVLVLAGVAVLAAGCGTKVARPPGAGGLTAAVTHTAAQTARVSVSLTVTEKNTSSSFRQTGLFDFARSRGVLRMKGPGGTSVEVVLIPPTAYIKVPGIPGGRSWIAVRGGAGAPGSLLPFGVLGEAGPQDLLASLRAVASDVRDLGSATVGGVPVTHYRVSIDPVRAAARLPRSQRAAFRAFAGSGPLPVDVWVDGQNLVRQLRISLHPPRSSGAPAGAHLSETVRFSAFGVPVRVSAPPAADVVSMPVSSSGKGVVKGLASSGPPRPPRMSGTLSAAQAAAAGQAVRRFWAALAGGDAAAAARVVLPAQRSCLRSALRGAPKLTVTSLRILPARPAGTARATVRFTAKARARLGGHSIPLFPSGHTEWIVTAQAGGHWYVDLHDSAAVPFLVGC